MKEIRKTHNVVRSADESSRHIEGYAVVFNSESDDLGGFVEMILPDALDGVVETSDVMALLDHKMDRGVLARCTNGEGSLKLSIDNIGLRFEFDAPHTALGDEVLEGIRRGDLSKCSFSFTCGEDEWKKKEDGTPLRIIKKISQLYDISIVYVPAYQETEVVADLRGLQLLMDDENNKQIDISMDKNKRSNQDIIEQIKQLMAELEQVDETIDEERDEDVVDEDEKTDEEVEEKADEEVAESEDENPDETEEKNDEVEEVKEQTETEDNEEIEENKRQKSHRSMKRNKFSLIKAIRDVAENRQLDEATKAVNKEGRNAMAKAGLVTKGHITLPIAMEQTVENRDSGIFATVVTQGAENVATEKLNILEPLRANMVLAKAGATYLTGLVGNVSIPKYSGSNVAWKGESAAADNGEGQFSEVELSPKRLTAYVDVSKQFLLQDSNDAEEMLTRDIINAIAEKLEQTIFGTAAGDINKPAGLFYDVTADNDDFTFADVVEMEGELDEANVSGNITYVVSPKAKAIMRMTPKDSGSGLFVMEDGEIEGTSVLCSSAVATKGVVVGDFSDYIVASWGGIDLTIDPYTKSTDGQIRIVVNAYFDAKPRRDEAFVKRILK